jgi:multiple sugar transport system substrate-binding protein
MKENAMLNRRALGTATAVSLFTPHVLRAQRATEITVHVPQPVIFRASFDAIAAAFARREPEIRVTWVTTPNYEEGLQLLLRQAATNSLTVDVSYQGFNRLRTLAERGIAQDVTPFLAREGDPAAQGYTPNLLALAHFGGFQSGLAYAASNPITFFNADLVRRAGGNPDALPRDWDGIIALAGRIREHGADGMFYNIGNEDWMFSALLFGFGGRMLSEDEREVAFAGPEGLAALRLIDRFMREARQPLLTGDAAPRPPRLPAPPASASCTARPPSCEG